MNELTTGVARCKVVLFWLLVRAETANYIVVHKYPERVMRVPNEVTTDEKDRNTQEHVELL